MVLWGNRQKGQEGMQPKSAGDTHNDGDEHIRETARGGIGK